MQWIRWTIWCNLSVFVINPLPTLWLFTLAWSCIFSKGQQMASLVPQRLHESGYLSIQTTIKGRTIQKPYHSLFHMPNSGHQFQRQWVFFWSRGWQEPEGNRHLVLSYSLFTQFNENINYIPHKYLKSSVWVCVCVHSQETWTIMCVSFQKVLA